MRSCSPLGSCAPLGWLEVESGERTSEQRSRRVEIGRKLGVENNFRIVLPHSTTCLRLEYIYIYRPRKTPEIHHPHRTCQTYRVSGSNMDFRSSRTEQWPFLGPSDTLVRQIIWIIAIFACFIKSINDVPFFQDLSIKKSRLTLDVSCTSSPLRHCVSRLPSPRLPHAGQHSLRVRLGALVMVGTKTTRSAVV